MKKLILLLVLLVSLAFSADYKPFTFSNVPTDSASQQAEFDYMLQYKLYGRDYLKVGNDVSIPDKSGWNGTSGYMTKLFSKSVAKHRCDYKEQQKGDRTVKKEEDFTTFGYKRPKK